MKFDSYYQKADVEDFMKTKEMRGHGVGVKSFTFSYEADNPYAIKKSIKAKLVIHANSFSELLKTRTYTALETDPTSTKDPPEQKQVYHEYSYIDLALKTGGNKTFSHDKMNPQNREVDLDNTAKLNFRLKAIVGWANPDVGSVPSVISGNLLEAIGDSAITLNLTPHVHEFGIDEMGRTTFTINYFAYVEDFFDHPNFNIFADEEVILNQTIRRLTYKALSEKCGTEEQEKKLADLKNSDEQAKLIENEKMINTRSILQNMLGEQKIRYLQIPIEKLNDYRKSGPFGKIDAEFLEQLRLNMGTATAETSEDVANKVEQDVNETGDDDESISKAIVNPNEAITFFYVSDLVDNLIKFMGNTLMNMPAHLETAIESNEDIKDELTEEVSNYKRFADNFFKFRLMLGPIEFINTNAKDRIVDTNIFNLGDIPISVKYFMEFLTERVLKSDRQTYTLPRFLNDFFNQFIKDFMNNPGCYGNRNKQKARLAQNAITAYREFDSPDDPITYWNNKFGTTRLNVNDVPHRPVLNVMGKRDNAGTDGGFENEINYLTYFIARTQPTETMLGDKTADHNRGIWHYQIGKDTGIVKTINLNKTDAPGLAEVRFEQEGYDGLQQLRVLYDVNIKSFLDVNTFPGTYIYVEPRGFDPRAPNSI